MLTKNGYEFFQFAGSGTTCYFKDTNGDNQTIYSNQRSNIVNAANRKVWVGTGETAATVNDITLDTKDSSLTEISSSSYPYSAAGGFATSYDDIRNFIFTCTTTYQNNTADPITIKEVGLVVGVTLLNSEMKYALLYREVLEAPETVEPGKSYAFSVTIG